MSCYRNVHYPKGIRQKELLEEVRLFSGGWMSAHDDLPVAMTDRAIRQYVDEWYGEEESTDMFTVGDAVTVEGELQGTPKEVGVKKKIRRYTGDQNICKVQVLSLDDKLVGLVVGCTIILGGVKEKRHRTKASINKENQDKRNGGGYSMVPRGRVGVNIPKSASSDSMTFFDD
ncbi:MAG: hypothetical protein QF486_02930 [Candidatus Woesearchaeota archaeon]|jgi:hypothetical protein|nr:hypothetical protein [Candidatus Woesearchaeota archaeon]MDP7466707.1 hypothetical protein [Candidatus Woesearchaeota archaeon]